MKLQIVSDLYLDLMHSQAVKSLLIKILRVPADVLVIPSGLTAAMTELPRVMGTITRNLEHMPGNKSIFIQLDEHQVQSAELVSDVRRNYGGADMLFRAIWQNAVAERHGRIVLYGLDYMTYGPVKTKYRHSMSSTQFVHAYSLLEDTMSEIPLCKLSAERRVCLVGYRRYSGLCHPSDFPPGAFSYSNTHSQKNISTRNMTPVDIHGRLAGAYVSDSLGELRKTSAVLAMEARVKLGKKAPKGAASTYTPGKVLVSTAPPVVHDGILVPYNNHSRLAMGGLYAAIHACSRTGNNSVGAIKFVVHGGLVSRTGVFESTSDGVIESANPVLVAANPMGNGTYGIVNPSFDPEFVVDLRELGVVNPSPPVEEEKVCVSDAVMPEQPEETAVVKSARKKLTAARTQDAVQWAPAEAVVAPRRWADAFPNGQESRWGIPADPNEGSDYPF